MVKIPNVTQEKQWREKLNVKSMGSGGMPTLMEKEIKDKIQFLTFSYFSSGQPKNYTNSLSQRHWISIDCLGTFADRNIHLGSTENGVMVQPRDATLGTWTIHRLLLSRDALLRSVVLNLEWTVENLENFFKKCQYVDPKPRDSNLIDMEIKFLFLFLFFTGP